MDKAGHVPRPLMICMFYVRWMTDETEAIRSIAEKQRYSNFNISLLLTDLFRVPFQIMTQQVF
jgi:hypothetical protein